MNWDKLKDEIYYLDGSLRDILVLNTTRKDWQIWVDFVNNNYKTSFHIYQTETTKDKIDYSLMLDYWNGKTDCVASATVYLDNIIIKSYFFDDQEIESDITPKEFNTLEDHKRLMEFMKGLSKALSKKVILTPENTQKIILLSVDKDEISFDS